MAQPSEEAPRQVKRDVLGIADRRKHQGRVAMPVQQRAKEAGTQQCVYRYRFYPGPLEIDEATE
ncbi:hypothetical protein [Streptomyces sp. CC208A]|uniref:hypothetical protein n=1 Tax=Streptomyces sp. CC208A TaxID=3044573 RepID=UPI0024A8F673|nr:hypothetical protein [Streptomyces sp. CC208A]